MFFRIIVTILWVNAYIGFRMSSILNKTFKMTSIFMSYLHPSSLFFISQKVYQSILIATLNVYRNMWIKCEKSFYFLLITYSFTEIIISYIHFQLFVCIFTYTQLSNTYTFICKYIHIYTYMYHTHHRSIHTYIFLNIGHTHTYMNTKIANANITIFSTFLLHVICISACILCQR